MARQPHYTRHSPQPIEILAEYLSKDEMKGYLKGNVLKYLLRSEEKGTELQDYAKGLQYMKWLVSFEKTGLIELPDP